MMIIIFIFFLIVFSNSLIFFILIYIFIYISCIFKIASKCSYSPYASIYAKIRAYLKNFAWFPMKSIITFYDLSNFDLIELELLCMLKMLEDFSILISYFDFILFSPSWMRFPTPGSAQANRVNSVIKDEQISRSGTCRISSRASLPSSQSLKRR